MSQEEKWSHLYTIVKSEIDKYILHIRLIAYNLLSHIDVNTTKYGLITERLCKYIDRLLYDHDNDEINNELYDSESKVYNIEDIKINFMHFFMSIF
jgi:hypothetical protein